MRNMLYCNCTNCFYLPHFTISVPTYLLYSFLPFTFPARWFDALILWVAFYYVSASQITVKTPESMEERLRFRDANSLTMRMAAYLGIGTQNAIWYVAIGATPFYRYAPWTFIALACGALLVLNIIVRYVSYHMFVTFDVLHKCLFV